MEIEWADGGEASPTTAEVAELAVSRDATELVMPMLAGSVFFFLVLEPFERPDGLTCCPRIVESRHSVAEMDEVVSLSA